MKPNPLAGAPLPRSVDVCGESVPVASGWRSGVRIMRILDSAEQDAARAEAALRAAFGDPLPPAVSRSRAAALEALVSWLGMGEEQPPPSPRRKARMRRSRHVRSWDWNRDADAVVADFQRFYGIDLADPGTDMHWWRFWSLFKNLPAGSACMDRIGVRLAEKDDFKGDAWRDMRERKIAAMLPARTEEEALANMELLNG